MRFQTRKSRVDPGYACVSRGSRTLSSHWARARAHMCNKDVEVADFAVALRPVKTGNTLVTILGLQMYTGDGDHLHSIDSPARWPVDYAVKEKGISRNAQRVFYRYPDYIFRLRHRHTKHFPVHRLPVLEANSAMMG
ncbi:hypothetical protein EVAR_60259_1 [Eumeta japonica]|uniref:Uncharacterized protein n=1 Tax=Eumeta variegata TaxID=151549 RepID=A0A4C1Z4H8_EUMVA|nr:hypothetical protein EVAR_60259_1 [Eumeta japonica]